MSLRIIWRSVVFVLTLMFIYLAFPILIVPSSLPAIQAMFIEQSYPKEYFPSAPPDSNSANETQIYQLDFPQTPTLKDKIDLLKKLHQQGMILIFPKD